MGVASSKFFIASGEIAIDVPSRRVVEVDGQRVDVTLREVAQPVTGMPLVRQCPVDVEDVKSIVQPVGFDPFPQVDEKPEKNDCRQTDFQLATIVDTPRSCFLDLQALSTSVPNLLFPGGSADSHICPTLRV